MKDIEGNRINLLQSPNAHILTWGRSGQGKTFFCQKQIEQAHKMGKQILVIDFSGSYTLEQLKKNEFVSLDKLKEFSPCNDPYYFMTCFKTLRAFQENLTNILISLLDIRGYFQKKLLLQSINKHFENHKTWNPSEYQETLESMLNNLRLKLNTDPEATTREDYEHAGKILARFEPFANIHNFHIKMLNTAPATRVPVHIIQLSEFPEIQREFLTPLFNMVYSLQTLIENGILDPSYAQEQMDMIERKKFLKIIQIKFGKATMKNGTLISPPLQLKAGEF